MEANLFNNGWRPPPILEHDIRNLTEISDSGDVKDRVLSAGCLAMDGVSKLVKEWAGIVVLQQAWLVGERLREIHNKSRGRVLAFP